MRVTAAARGNAVSKAAPSSDPGPAGDQHQRAPSAHDEWSSAIPAPLFDESTLWRPDYMDGVTAWTEHAPFAFWLVGTVRPRTYVELGTHTGFSYFAVCQAVERRQTGTSCYAIDTWIGDEHAGFYGAEVYDRVSAYEQAHYSAFSTLIRETFDEAVARFPDGSIDLLHIDGQHFYEDARHDFETWRPKLSERAIVLFHDTNVRERGFGVYRLWQELRNEYPAFEFLHGHGLGVLGYGTDIPQALAQLLALQETDPDTRAARTFYGALGASVSDHIARMRLETQLADAKREQERTAKLLATHGRGPTEAENAIILAERDDANRKLREVQATNARLQADLQAATDIRGQAMSLIAWPVTSLWRRSPLHRPSVLRASPLFDAAWYRQRYPDVGAARGSPWRHYWRHGRREGRDPNAFFDGDWYRAQNADILASRTDPLDHYLRRGGFEGRDPSPRFASAWYLERYPDVIAESMNPLLHFLQHGQAEGREPHPSPPAASNPIEPTADGDDRPDTPPPAASFPQRGLFSGTLFGDRVTGAPGRTSLGRAWTYYRRNGLGPLVRRIGDEVRRLAPFPPSTGRTHRGPWKEKDPRNIFASVDAPRGSVVVSTPDIAVLGWACARTGIASVDLYVDATPAGQATTGEDRPDVAQAYPNVAGVATSGFSALLSTEALEPGEHTLTVAIHDQAGSTRVFNVRFTLFASAAMYHKYFVRMLPSADEIETERASAASRGPLPSFRILVFDIPGMDLGQTLRSIAEQGYPAWHCSVIVDESSLEHAANLLFDIADAVDPRFELIVGSWSIVDEPIEPSHLYCYMSAGETLSPHALECFAHHEHVHETNAVLYSDHDTIERSGRHRDPWFNPDWSPDHLLSRDYIGGIYAVRDSPRLRDALRGIPSFDGPAWRYDLLLRLTDTLAAVAHIPRVLWAAPVLSTAGRALLAAAELAVVTTALERRETGATATVLDLPGVRRITWPIDRHPLVSIIIPTTGRMDLVEPCVTSLTMRTSYDNYELVFLDNGRGAHQDGIDLIRSRGYQVIERNEPFNWARLNNVGARAASGELLLFLNDDIEVTDPDWLTELVRLAVRPDIGTVGALLTYPDGRIQHAGVVLVGHGGGAMHLMHKADPARGTYLDLHRLVRETTANTGACLMVSREHFERVNGFDEELEVVGNDIDLCLRISAAGFRNIWTPFSTLIHHESLSRTSVSVISDETRMWRRWSDALKAGDPFFNPNLAQDRPDCSIDWSRMARRTVAPVDRTNGVNLVGYIRAEMGIGEATRGQAQAMTDARIPFVTIDYGLGNPARMGDDSFAHTIVSEPVYDVNLVYVNANVLGQAMSSLPSGLRRGRYTIGQWAWEMPEFPDRAMRAFDLVDEVWCPSEFVRNALASKSPVPVVRVPHAIRTPQGPLVGREHFGLPDAPYQFLMMYDVNSVQERKNPRGAYEAFTRAFPADDLSVMLVIKINNADPLERREIREMIADRPNVAVIDRVLDRYEVDSLLWTSDAFVSLHRSEGFGLTIAEAMNLGRPVIATHWSGNVDFMTEDNSGCVRYTVVQLQKAHGPYAAGQHWAEPDLDHAAWWMQRLRDDRAFGEQLGKRGQATIQRDFSPLTVGRSTSRRLDDIRSRSGASAPRP